jgi:hypothetical protein
MLPRKSNIHVDDEDTTKQRDNLDRDGDPAMRRFFADGRGIRHSVDVEAESLYEAAILGVRRFRKDPWLEPIGDATVIDVEVREPATKHALSLNQIERWLSGVTTNPSEASKKAKLKMLLIQS